MVNSMSEFIKCEDRGQTTLFPECLDDCSADDSADSTLGIMHNANAKEPV